MESVLIEGRSGTLMRVNRVREDFPVHWYGKKQLVVPHYDQSFSKYIVDAVQSRIEDGHDNIILVTGPRRAGKSTLTSQLARAVDPKFSVDNVAFPLAEFSQILTRNPRADPANRVFPQVILDEAGYDLYAGNWMTLVSKNMVRKFEVIGEKGQTVWLVLPHRMKLVKGIREDMAEYWISVRLLGRRQERGFAILRRAEPSEWYEESYWQPEAVFEFDAFPPDDEWWAAYMQKKRTFVDFAAAEDPEEEAKFGSRQRLLAQRNKCVRKLYERAGLNQQQIADMLGMTQAAVSLILNQAPS